MNLGQATLWGFVATIVLTTMMSGSRALGFTRMDVPFMLGTMFTGNRDRAKWVGFLLHVLNGWGFALIYIAAFHSTGWFSAWFGALMGLVQSLFVLIAGMLILPSMHPRMATEQQGPTPTRQLEPPGFMARNYGKQTPVVNVLAHVVYGALLGFFYHP